MARFDQAYTNQGNTNITYLLDQKQGDVTGDSVPDHVYLYGYKPGGPSSGFADHITLAIQDGRSRQLTTVPLPVNAGYNARLFLGEFSKDQVDDILVSIDTGGSGGYGIFYVYSFNRNVLRELFNFEAYNREYSFRVDYEDQYRVAVSSPSLDVLFTIDISTKGTEYLSTFYTPEGKLKQPVQGEVLAIGGLFPIVTNERSDGYDLLAMQRIIGTTNADTLGYVQNELSWNGSRFVSTRLTVSILGTKLVAHF